MWGTFECFEQDDRTGERRIKEIHVIPCDTSSGRMYKPGIAHVSLQWMKESWFTGKSASELNCPVCGYYCLGKGGVGCIDKPKLVEIEHEE
jgi:hypothetical protein